MNILLLQLKRIGDLVLTTPTIAALREALPSARLDLVVARGCAPLLPAIAGLDRALVAGSGPADSANWLRLGFRRYEYCLDFTRTDRSGFLTALSGARRRLTYERTLQKSRWRPLIYTDLIPSSVREFHTADFYQSFLDPLGIAPGSSRPQLHLPEGVRAQTDSILASAGIARPYVVFHPGSARAEKYWVPERWAEVIQQAARAGAACLLTGGSDRLEQEHLRQIKALAGDVVSDLSGRLDLPGLAEVIRRARLLVGVDSATTHLADAVGTRQVALYGPTNPFHWRPRHVEAVILRAGHDQPLRQFEPDQPGAPMNLISTQSVIDAMETLLSDPAATGS